ncbi:thioredoxin H-type-like isoform X2 [Cucurbita pepo subsp. pepo]|uniref:thioredoxin H-type-like isoform X2 n=1 Tax=Cucurbita pepo subsp. pepo TaxID=3664 RepID=UPI000C9D9AA9|nr:thioredoxin H-type-like isoform X2 [Cucurbita pepo subsp. pepo]
MLFNSDQKDNAVKEQVDSKNVHLITSIEKWEAKLSEATKDGKIVVANFSAPWCRPCKSMTPAFCELADKYTSMVFLAIDVDELAELSKSWDIKATPTFVFFKDGRQVDKLIGADKSDLQQKIAAMDEA